MQWAFFIDANLKPHTADILRKEGYRTEYLDYVLLTKMIINDPHPVIEQSNTSLVCVQHIPNSVDL